MLDWMLAAAATSNIKLWEISLSSSAFVFDSKIHFYELAGNLFSAFFLHCVDFLIFARLPSSSSFPHPFYVLMSHHIHIHFTLCAWKSLNFSTIIYATFFWFSFATFIFSLSFFSLTGSKLSPSDTSAISKRDFRSNQSNFPPSAYLLWHLSSPSQKRMNNVFCPFFHFTDGQTHWHQFFVLSDMGSAMILGGSLGNILKKSPLQPTIFPISSNKDDVFR